MPSSSQLTTILKSNPFIDIMTYGHSIESEDVLSVQILNATEKKNDQNENVKGSSQSQFFSLGLHPWHCGPENNWKENLKKLQSIIERKAQHEFLFYGEFGLDHLKGATEQEEALRLQLDYLNQHPKLICIIHCVRAHNRLLEIMREMNFKNRKLIFHAFSSQTEVLEGFRKDHEFVAVSLGPRELLREKKATRALHDLPYFFETDESDQSIKACYEMASKMLKVSEDVIKKKVSENFLKLIAHF